MTPKEKALELIKKFEDLVAIDYKYDEMPIFDCQKQCALIVVDEIINSQSLLNDDEAQLYDDLADTQYLSYWEIVKSEIELLC